MTRDDVLVRLRPLEPELRAGGIASLYLFGSMARGDARDDSDIDLLYELGNPDHFGLFELYGLQDRISRQLDREVDLVSRKSLRPRVRKFAEPEMIRIF